MHDTALLNFMLMFGGIIVAGFLGNVLFRITKIPSVLLLMFIGVILGPVTQVVPAASVEEYASYFGTVALLIILFEGGLDLDYRTVIQQLGKSIFLTISVFLLTFFLTAIPAVLLLGLEPLVALLLGGIVGGTSPAIVIPIVNKLRVSKNFKTIMFLEPALADVLIIVSVVIGLQVYEKQSADTVAIIGNFVSQLGIATVLAVVLGALWARFIGSLRDESVSYMLTLGFLFLLYWVAEMAGGNGVIAVFLFGIVLANMEDVAKRLSGGVRRLLGVKLDATHFALDEFVHNITVELSFLVRVFFFVLLGLLFKFDDLTWLRAAELLFIVLACVLGRLLGGWLFSRFNKDLSRFENLVMHAMLPRGLATAVMAFVIFNWRHPETGASIPGTELFPFYALGVIMLTNVIMTGMVTFGSRVYDKDTNAVKAKGGEAEVPLGSGLERLAIGQGAVKAPPRSEGRQQITSHISQPWEPSEAEQPEPDSDVPPEEEELDDRNFTERLIEWLRISPRRFSEIDYVSTRALRLRNFVYWLQILATTMIAILGMMMNNASVILAGMLLSPVLALYNTLSLSLTEGDIYMFIKGFVKLAFTGVVIVVLSAMCANVVPFAGIPEEIMQRTQPTVLDFTLGFFVGLFVPIVMFRGRQIEIFAVSPIVALMMFPPLAVVGYGIGSGSESEFLLRIVVGGLLSFSANSTGLFIGAVLTLLALGVTQHRASGYIRDWKKRELASGLLARILRPLGVTRFLGTTGTIGARLTVLVLLGLALIIPLQTTINDISRNYKIEQTIKELSQRFEISDRSSIISTDIEHKNDVITARIRVATREFFTNEDIRNFEQEARDRLDTKTRLFLVQSQGNVGNVASGVAARNTREGIMPESFANRLSMMQVDFQRTIAELPPLRNGEFLGAGTRFNTETGAARVTIDYMAPEPLDDYAVELCRTAVAPLLGIPESFIYLEYVPNLYHAREARLEAMRNPAGKLDARTVLNAWPSLSGTIVLPFGLQPDSLSALERHVRAQHSSLADTLRFGVQQGVDERVGISFLR